MNKISVITATYNAIEHIPRLIESLRAQTDQDYEWVVADGKSEDGTVQLLNSINDLNITISSEKDFGIYDALNRGVIASKGDFYLVIGADDYLFPDAIENFKKEISNSVDVVTSSVATVNGVKKFKQSWAWLYGMQGIISGHAVSTIFRKNLHDKVGLYSNQFPIAADQLFVKKIYIYGAKVKVADFTAGYFNHQGLSGSNIAGSLSETFRVQLITEKFNFIQVLIFILRIIKNYRLLKDKL
ncbi:glycosyltransferase [Marinomonas flavescens]|uniref:glycosyltransferase n=1 Tax=Marinomonas flavescens TaxID=2529379 RepID=UPI00105595DB|nr:glycosyltransferase [Marinomonas flavescens]